MDIQKIPPHDEDAEEAVIGSMLTDKDAVIAAIEVLKPEDFYRDDNKTIFEAEASIYAKGEPIDFITVKEELISMGKFNTYGQGSYNSKHRKVCKNCWGQVVTKNINKNC